MQDWRKQANCLGVSLDTFFIESKDMSKVAIKIKEARKYCDNCAVQIECLNYAIDNSIKDGIYGGMAPKQRYRIKRGRKLSEIK
jgi:WhiB family redox-sensing transcriptional regulator